MKLLPLTAYSLNFQNLSDNLVDIDFEEGYIPVPKNDFFTPKSKKKTFQDLITALNQAEPLLIAKGYKTIQDRIHILRGIYYGTNWSIDYFVEQSPVRNKAFQLYTASLEPADPRPIIGADLYKTLFDCAEVYEGKKSLDWGHLIIGLDARRSYFARERNAAGHASTGLEITTWIGDLGGAAGMLSIKRITNAKHRAINMFKGSSFGGVVNLEGDAAAYLVARDKTNFDATPSIGVDKDSLLATALNDYLYTDATEWSNRGLNFLKFLGAEIDAKNNISNFDALKTALASEILDFGENYMVNRLRQSSSASSQQMYDASCHLIGCANEITRLKESFMTFL